MAEKEFKTIDEQIEILKGRGLSIEDEIVARDFLLRNNYYRISGYSLTLRSNDVFHPGTTFRNIQDIYEFDHELRHILLRYIEVIEVTVKSIYAYEFTKKFGATGYLDSRRFADVKKHQEIMSKAEKQKEARRQHEAYLKHYLEDLKQEIPLWAFVDLLTIADISFLYKISDPTIKEAVASKMGLEVKGASILESFMHSITIIRNLCAHGSRLFNRLFEQKPSLKRSELKLLMKSTNGEVDNAHLFGFIILLRRLLITSDFNDLKNDIIRLSEKYPFVGMRYYGFPSGWECKI